MDRFREANMVALLMSELTKLQISGEICSWIETDCLILFCASLHLDFAAGFVPDQIYC